MDINFFFFLMHDYTWHGLTGWTAANISRNDDLWDLTVTFVKKFHCLLLLDRRAIGYDVCMLLK